tara:strand:+ start:5867 stop:6178 length:312 start_codon:yes stop_codon:yes gene_type:complete
MIDMNKKYTFRGETGRVLAVDANRKGCPVMWLRDKDGAVYTFTNDGRLVCNGMVALVEVKPTRWVNIYPYVCCGFPHDSREAADEYASTNRIACIEFKDGEGL